jgi:hypothetical protein
MHFTPAAYQPFQFSFAGQPKIKLKMIARLFAFWAIVNLCSSNNL